MRGSLPHLVGVLLIVAGCGASIPGHSGYKSDKAQPWKKAKPVKFDDKGAAKVEGDLSYAEFKRARWHAIDLTGPTRLELTVEASPEAPYDDDDFDLGLEVYGPTFELLAESDAESDDAGELSKERSLPDLGAGRYYVHLFLQRRVDRASYELRINATPTFATSDGGFAMVAFPPRLPLVPLDDDTPASAKPKPKPPSNGPRPPRPPRPPPSNPDTPPPASGGPVTGSVINVVVSGSGTTITLNRGTDHGLAAGKSGRVTGIKQGSFTIASCSARTCSATVGATPDEVRRSGKFSVP